MSKSIESQLKELIEASVAQTKALSEKVDAQASEGNTYTERMKKMEENLANAMKTVLGMDASMKEFNKMVESKLSEMEKKYAIVNVNVEDDGDEENEDEVETETKNEEDNVDEEMKKEEASDAKCKPKAGEMPTVEESPVKDNKIEGVNEQVVSTKKKKKAKGSKSEDVERIDESSNAKYEKSVEAEASSVAEEVKQEVLAQSTEVKQEVSIEKLSQALQNKIDSVIEKISNSKVETNASNELAEKLALEQKAKEDAVRHFKALEEKFEALMAKVSKLESTDKTVETKVAQIVASTGIDAVAVSVDTQMSQENASDEDVFKKFESLSGAEQRKYYVENKDIIARHASALLRQNKRS